MSRPRKWRIQAIIVSPFRTGLDAIIPARDASEAMRKFNDVYPVALISSIQEYSEW